MMSKIIRITRYSCVTKSKAKCFTFVQFIGQVKSEKSYFIVKSVWNSKTCDEKKKSNDYKRKFIQLVVNQR